MKLIAETGSFEYTLNILRILDERITTAINDLGGNPYLEGIMTKLRVGCLPPSGEQKTDEDAPAAFV